MASPPRRKASYGMNKMSRKKTKTNNILKQLHLSTPCGSAIGFENDGRIFRRFWIGRWR